MSLKKTLSALVQVIVDEAEQNADFKIRIEQALRPNHQSSTKTVPPALVGESKRKGGRRTQALLDPVEIARRGESTLRSSLTTLNLEQLRDIVAEYGMDPGKLVMKWKDANRVVDRIVEISLSRSTKGDAFRGE